MGTNRALSPIDTTFLKIESNETPMHVGSLMVVAPPHPTSGRFAATLVQGLSRPDGLAEPFDQVVSRSPLSRILPTLVTASRVDMTYHVRHTRLPEPGGERELGDLVSHLHGVVLDRSRPLWTCHVIEGLADGRVAIYTKVHHALLDGVKGIRLTATAAGSSPEDSWSGPWHVGRAGSSGPVVGARARIGSLPRAVPSAVSGLVSMSRATTSFIRKRDVEPVRRPFESPRSKLNGRVTAARRVATQQLDLKRIRAVGAATDASVNDVFLSVCSSAIRRHLLDSGELPLKSLIAGIPVNVQEGSGQRANSSGFALAALATNIDDPLERLSAITASTRAIKAQLAPMSPGARLAFLSATFVPSLAVLLSGTGALLPPPMNVTISNVPGPKSALYMNGGLVEALYPVSIPFQGQALNITCISYAGHLNVGFTGSRDSLPHLQRLALYASEALDELVDALRLRE